MSTTPNARKAAAREHQREHGGSYTAALAAVSPEAAAAARSTGSEAPNVAAAAAIQAVRYFDEVTTEVVGQGSALTKLRIVLSQYVVAALRDADKTRFSVEIGAPATGLWEEEICLAFAQAWMLGTTGALSDVRTPDPESRLTRVGDAVVSYGTISRADLYIFEESRLGIRFGVGPLGSGAAIQLEYLGTRNLGLVAVRRLEEMGTRLDFTAENITRDEVGSLLGTGHEARDVADKALARALIRSSIDKPGSPAELTFDDLVESFKFLIKVSDDRRR